MGVGEPRPADAGNGAVTRRQRGYDAGAARSSAEPITPAEMSATLYLQLRRIAQRAMQDERPDHTLSPTALVHEVWLKLARSGNHAIGDRIQFIANAAVAMRRILVDHARRQKRLKRGGAQRRVQLDTSCLSGDPPTPCIDLLALDEALSTLAAISPDRARVVELRCFGGLEPDEIAVALGLSPATVRRHWAGARAWLQVRLGRGS